MHRMPLDNLPKSLLTEQVDRNPTANGCKAVPEIHAVFGMKNNLLQFIDATEKLHDDESNEIYRSVKNKFCNFHFCSHYEILLA